MSPPPTWEPLGTRLAFGLEAALARICSSKAPYLPEPLRGLVDLFPPIATRVRKQLKDPTFCYDIGDPLWGNWTRSRRLRFGDAIIAGLTQDLELTYKAAQFWQDEPFAMFADAIMAPLIADPEFSVRLICNEYSDQRIRPYLQAGLRTVQAYPAFHYHLHQKLKEKEHVERLLLLADGFPVYEDALNPAHTDVYRYYDALTSETLRKTLLQLSTRIPAGELVRLPRATFKDVAAAYAFARQTKHEDEFATGLQTSMREGTVEPWTDSILDTFRHPESHDAERVLRGAA